MGEQGPRHSPTLGKQRTLNSASWVIQKQTNSIIDWSTQQDEGRTIEGRGEGYRNWEAQPRTQEGQRTAWEIWLTSFLTLASS